MIEQIPVWEILSSTRVQNPVVHNITNFVVMNWTANCLLALGASPIMAHAPEEVEAVLDLAHALVINIGTLDNAWIHSMRTALDHAKKKNIPVVFDPVGAGATPYRTQTARRLIEDFAPTVIRANASEILSLQSDQFKTKGVDNAHSPQRALPLAHEISGRLNCVVCISGETDYIVDKNKVIEIKNGHPLMTRATGMGCAASALIAALLPFHESSLAATAAAMILMGVAGEIAAESASGPGTFQTGFLDALYKMDSSTLAARQRFKA